MSLTHPSDPSGADTTTGCTLRKLAGTGVTTIDVPLDSSGSIQVQSGTLELRGGDGGGSQITGSIDATGNAIWFSGGGPPETSPPVTHRLSGMSLNAGTLKTYGNVDVIFDEATDVNVTDSSLLGGVGTVTFAATTTITSLGDVATVTGGDDLTVNFFTPIPASLGTLIAAGTVNFDNGPTQTLNDLTVAGTVTGPTSLTVAGLLTFYGRMSGAGPSTTTTANGGLDFRGGGAILLARTLINNALATWSPGPLGGTLLPSHIAISRSAVFQNNGTLEVTGPNSGIISSSTRFYNPAPLPVGTPAFINDGTLRILGGTTYIDAPFNNTGTIEVQGGALALTADSNISGPVDATGHNVLLTDPPAGLNADRSWTGATHTFGSVTLKVAQLRMLRDRTVANFQGTTINGDLDNRGGQVNIGNPIGTLPITGNYYQSIDASHGTGVLNLDIGGPSAGSQFDQLVVDGNAYLGGTLNISLVSGFAPEVGDSFPIFVCGACSGTFAGINGLVIDATRALDPAYNATNLTLSTILASATRTSTPVPPTSTATPTSTRTATVTRTATPTRTNTSTPSPGSTATVPVLECPLPAATATGSPTELPTDTPADTPTPTSTDTPSPPPTPTNAPPVVDADGPYAVDEGGSVTLTASGSDIDGDQLDYVWDLDNDGAFETPGQSAVFSGAGLDGPGAATVVARVTDSGGLEATDAASVQILNVAPTLSDVRVMPAAINEDDSADLTGRISDPGADSFTLDIDWGNGTPVQSRTARRDDGLQRLTLLPG